MVRRRVPVGGDGIRDRYAADDEGATGYYARFGSTYANPHGLAVESAIARSGVLWPDLFVQGRRWLDLCAGAGEVTRALRAGGVPDSAVVASDPFTGASFERACGRAIDADWSFADIAGGAAAGLRVDTVACSYALHLCEPSWLALVALALADVAPTLLVITPHKRPELRPEWGWDLLAEHRDPETRARLRRYRSRAGAIDVPT